MNPSEGTVAGSFRDPSGFLFWQRGELYRQVNVTYREDYDLLTASGLADQLWSEGLLVHHEECPLKLARTQGAYKVIRPDLVPFISYPYEWCFSQLQDAARLILAIQKKALAFGMSLKDASAYNVQFVKGRPLFIDTLSFEKYPEGRPWAAYRQFCQHFLAPLALMAHVDARMGQLSRQYLDGVPLDLASRLLPASTRLRFSLLSHIHLHARAQKRYEGRPLPARRHALGRFALQALLDSLETAVRKLRWLPRGTEWAEYYDQTNYSEPAREFKERFVADSLQRVAPGSVWDIGANTGAFSRLAAARGIPTVALDVDAAAVEKNYLECRRDGNGFILPLICDITSPSPGLGWENRERASLLERGPCGMVLALALVHHLAIGNNLPLAKIAAFFARLGGALVVEFIPKEDSQVQRLLSTREDIFPNYHPAAFQDEFSRFFRIERKEAVPQSERILYLMRSLDHAGD